MILETVLATILFIGAAGYLVLGGHLLVALRETGSLPIGTIFALIFPILAGGGIELLAGSEFVFNMGRAGHFVSTALLPVAAYVCFREYTGGRSPSWSLVLLLIIPFVSISLAATNAAHGLMWPVPAVTRPANS